MDIKGTQYVIQVTTNGQKDGNIHTCPILLLGKQYTVDEWTYKRWLSSVGDDELEVVQVLIPNPRKKAKKDE
jgi:hypothetical protein